jgi:hypothetical protein
LIHFIPLFHTFSCPHDSLLALSSLPIFLSLLFSPCTSGIFGSERHHCLPLRCQPHDGQPVLQHPPPGVRVSSCAAQLLLAEQSERGELMLSTMRYAVVCHSDIISYAPFRHYCGHLQPLNRRVNNVERRSRIEPFLSMLSTGPQTSNSAIPFISWQALGLFTPLFGVSN